MQAFTVEARESTDELEARITHNVITSLTNEEAVKELIRKEVE